MRRGVPSFLGRHRILRHDSDWPERVGECCAQTMTLCRCYRSTKERVRSNGLAIGANDFDARGRSPMGHQRIHLSLGGEAGGRSPGFILGT
jgi:hypothetical protein